MAQRVENWDRKADVDSKGTVLFYNWARKFNLWQGTNYATAWDINNPITTPDGISDPARAVQLLEDTAEEIQNKFGRLDVTWGDYYRINYNGKDLPASGSDGSVGSVRVAWPGNADEKDSPHNGDQLELFSKKEMRHAWFTVAEVEANTVKIEKINSPGY